MLLIVFLISFHQEDRNITVHTCTFGFGPLCMLSHEGDNEHRVFRCLTHCIVFCAVGKMYKLLALAVAMEQHADEEQSGYFADAQP